MADALRLDRYLSEETDFTRSQIKKLLKSGRVCVNGSTDLRPEQKVLPSEDSVLLDGLPVRPTGLVYLMMNKPSGVLSATEDRRQKTVIDLVERPYADRLFPVGRLDKDTEGLLLLTNDGVLAHQLLSPRKHVSKTYFAIVDGKITQEDEGRFLEGLDIGEKRNTLPALLRTVTVDGDLILRGRLKEEERPEQADPAAATDSGSLLIDEIQMKEFCLRAIALSDFARCGEGQCCCAAAVTEGRFHQVKRMFEAVGRQVLFLKRIGMGSLCLEIGRAHV